MSHSSTRIGFILERIRHTVAAQGAVQACDHDLLARYVSARDESAFAALVTRYGPLVMGLCWRLLRHRQDAEDAFQAAFLVLARKAGSIRKRELLASWLHSVAFRAATRLRAANARRRARQTALMDVPQARGCEDLTLGETQRVLEEELNRLADKYRAPLLLCCVQGRTRDEAAQQLGWSLGVLRGRLDRGRELLRARLARRGVALSGALLPLAAAGVSEAALLPALVSSTVRAALGAAPSSVSAAAASAQAAALAQGVIQAMFLAKMKVVAIGVLLLALVGTSAGVVTYRAQAQEVRPTVVAQTGRENPFQSPRAETDPAQLRREIARLRLELEQTRLLLKLANQEILELRAARAQAGKSDAKADPDLVRKRAVQALGTLDKKQPPDDHQSALSPDRRVIAAAQQNAVSIFDAETGKEMRRFLGHGDTVSAVAFTPDGKRLASGSKDSSVILWDVATGKQILRYAAQNPVNTLTFTPDGRRLVIGHKGQTSEIDVQTGQVIRSSKQQLEK
jgi:RNA polymerase sigma factor (sigma-70 family)